MNDTQKTSERKGRSPQQHRSKSTFNNILKVSKELIGEVGITNLKMSHVAKRAEVPIGTVYRYFPDCSSILIALLQPDYEFFRKIASKHLEDARNKEELADAFSNLIYEIYERVRRDKLWMELWSGAAADRKIRDIHQEDAEKYLMIYFKAARRFIHDIPEELLMLRLELLNRLVDGTILLALTKDKKTGKIMLQEAINILLRELGIAPLDSSDSKQQTAGRKPRRKKRT